MSTKYNSLEILLTFANVLIAVVSIAVVFIPGMLAYVG